MTQFKKAIFVFIFVTVIVSIVNGILCYRNSKHYTISYPKTLQDVQKNIEEDIVEINDKVVTQGSVIILATKQNGNMYLYHLERGFLTLKYKMQFYDTCIQKDLYYSVKDCFNKFEYYVSEDNRIEINPATFTGYIMWNVILTRWLLPITYISELIILYFKRKKNDTY